MEILLDILIVSFALMWIVGFIWQFSVKKRFKAECPSEYGAIHRDGFHMKAKNDLRFVHYLLTRKYKELKDVSLISYLDTFRWFVISFFFVFTALVTLVILNQ